MKLHTTILGILLSFNAFADGFTPVVTSQDQPWSLVASFGGGKYQIYSKDNLSPLARFAVANEMLLSGDYALGWELGFQNGNNIHLNIPAEKLTSLGWLPVNTRLSPMFDLLATAKSDPLAGSLIFAQLKGGIAYRYWQIEQIQMNNLSRVAGEVQAGFGFPITSLAELNLLYQGVYGSKATIQYNPIDQTGRVSNIPALHAIFLGLSVNL
ncbi:MAG: hypothetical protein H0U75_05020 [Legionella sp.]|nr:hypothetical protein [Legionella sp.]